MSILNWSATAASNDIADLANGIDWREGQLAATVNNSSRATMAALYKFVQDISGDLTTTGSGAAYVLTTAQTITSLSEPLILAFKASFTSNAAATLNVDGLGAISILRKDGTATQSGDIVSTGAYMVMYSAALSKFIGINILGAALPIIGGTLTGQVIAAAGTTAIAPLKFQSGTNLTTAASGAWEFDGIAPYFTSVASSRGVVPQTQIASVANGAKTALSNSSTSAQNIFASANDVLTVAASTAYRFRSRITLNTGTTSHTTSFGIALTTATLTAIHYTSLATSSAADTLSAPQMRRVSTNTAAVLTAASVAATTDIVLEGIIRVSTAGQITPQITFSAGPTGTCEVEVDSFFEIWPIGSDALVAVGNWA